MTHEERIRTFLPLLIGKTITQEQYDGILRYPSNVSEIHPADNGISEDTERLEETMEEVQVSETLRREEQSAVSNEPDGHVAVPGLTPDATHPVSARGNSQKARIYSVLSDGEWHNSNEISYRVYGGHGGTRANWTARMTNLRADLEEQGYKLLSRKITPQLWEYRIAK